MFSISKNCQIYLVLTHTETMPGIHQHRQHTAAASAEQTSTRKTPSDRDPEEVHPPQKKLREYQGRDLARLRPEWRTAT